MESDRELLERYLAQGEETAFAELVRRHLPHVFGAALRRTGDRGLAEDVSQEVFEVCKGQDIYCAAAALRISTLPLFVVPPFRRLGQERRPAA